MLEPKKRDAKAPLTLSLEIKDDKGRVWGQVKAMTRHYFSGSVGFHARGRIENPESNELYRVGGNIILIGSRAV